MSLGEGRGEAGERRLLLEAAISIAAVRGFADTTVEMILERCGLDRQAFERHFGDLRECFLAAWDSLRDEFLARVDAAVGEREGWRERVRALARETSDCATEQPDEARLLASEVMELGPAGRVRLDGLLDRLAGMVDGGRELAPDPARIPPSTAQGVIGGAHHRLVRELRAQQLTPSGRLAAELASFAVIPYLGIEAGLAELDLPS